MDWTQIITALIETGGLVGVVITLVTLTEKKGAAMLENAKALASSYKELAEEYKEREARTEARIQAKESALLDSNKMCSSLRHDLDDAHTECAVANILRCEVTECVKRRPPLGATADTVVENAKEATRRVYDGQEQ